MNGGGKVVCVTGASCYIASWIVKLLLLRGYTVKATVRDPKDQKKTDHLLALDGARERLQLFKASLLEEGSFEHAIDGCEAVFHTASPVKITATDPQVELIEPAVKGTINVLKTCTKVSSVKRVILTSSMATLLSPKFPLGPNVLLDETTFSDPTVCEEEKQWYILSKTLAENAAWTFAKDNNLDLVVMNPGLVIGPVLQPTINFSVDVVIDFIKGKNTFNRKHHRLVDVRDVALAHIKALETPSAKGRYIIDAPIVTTEEIEKILREFFPDLCIAHENEEIDLNSMTCKVNVEKVKSLGIEFTPTETSLRDTVLKDQKKTDHLLALDGARERLQLFKASLLEEGSFEHAIDGCDAVFHTASPVKIIATDPQAELIEPAVKGTINVLATCTKVSSVKRVILTSSMATLLSPNFPLGPNVLLDETTFSDPSVCEEEKQWYILSKTLAENAAWTFAKDNNLDLVVMNPGLVIGPVLQPTINFSVDVVIDFIKGKNTFNRKHHRLVDVRDVALAHIKALETPSAKGRYIIDAPIVTTEEIEKILREFFPDLCIAHENEEIDLNSMTCKVNVEKVKSLGIEFTPTETSLRDTVLSLKEKHLV
ncbi:hypothetical protein Bca52824_079347 [Brassica carinata]|uniref:NAD-dependent epimerase/dehydratase domain-containing protein n=1 Tax=Brassica carinata TaxID=52824 RepID=A0A8X7PZE6_BRACI|nr:hypothetical protein Bca52824_079347 [Brassica carinata]